MILASPTTPRMRKLLAGLLGLSLMAMPQSPVAAPTASSAALQPLEQLRHTRWTNADGAPANIMAIAQTPDGFLWLGTATGLYRFDGIRFELITPAGRDPARSLQVTALLTARNGDLWVGYDYGGVAMYRRGALRSVNDRIPRGSISDILEASDGKIWVSSRSAYGPFIRYFDHRRWHWPTTGLENPAKPIQAIHLQRDGKMLVVAADDVVRLSLPDTALTSLKKRTGQFPAFAQDSAGTVWIADKDGLARLDGKGRRLPLPPVKRIYVQRKMVFDRDGNLWMTGHEAGVLRIALATLEQLSRGERPSAKLAPFNALSGGVTLSAYQDREGNIWMGSQEGLDRFAKADVNLVPSVPLLSTRFIQQKPGMPILFGGPDGIYQLGDRPGEARRMTAIAGAILNFCADAEGQMVILSSGGDVIRMRDQHKAIDIKRIDREGASACASDGRGGFWISARDTYHLSGAGLTLADGPIRSIETATLMRTPAPGDLLAYRALDSLKLYHGGKVSTLWQGRDIPIGFIKTVVPDHDGLLIGGEHGLARFDGQRFQVLDDHDHPFFANVAGILPLSDGSTWIITAEGIARIPTDHLDAAFKNPSLPISAFKFGQDQGLRARSNVYDLNDVIQDAHGLLWFATNRGLAWLDPKQLIRNALVPKVVIRALMVSGQAVPIDHDTAIMSAGTRQISIDYTALSLTDATANQFRYRLQGVDPDWVAAGTNRQADYNNLHPGTYRFQVIAANADGVWNEAGATLTVTIKPYFYQTWWFALGILLTLAVIGILLARWRLSEAAATAQHRIEARVEERERIARELHDTLLQGLQGLLLRFQAVAEILSPNAPARDMIENALERGDDVIVESRDRVRNLRQADAVGDLEDALVRLAQDGVQWRVSENRRPVCGPVVEEAVAIVGEALGNARKHSGATHVYLEVTYRWSSLTIEVRDDGCGIDPKILEAGGKEGHFGLIGMRERARQLHARLTISSKVGHGTTVRLRIPGRIAYKVKS